MAKAINTKVSQQPAVLPAIPASIEGKAFFGGRLITQNHTDVQQNYQDTYISQGLFRDPASDSSKAALIKGMTCYFDLDLIDLYDNDEGLQAAKAWYESKSIDTIYASSDGRAITLVNVSAQPIEGDRKREKARQQDRKNVIKAYLTAKPQAELISICEEKATVYIDQLIELIGKPTMITYTGTGIHAHYFIDEREGWTDAGVRLAGDNTLIANRDELKIAQKNVIAEIARYNDGISFDKARCDAGLGVTRDVGTSNQKCSSSTKAVQEIMSSKCDPNRQITLTDLTIEVTKPARKSGSGFRDRVKGKESAAPKASGHDKRVKREKARLQAHHEITYVDATGNQVTETVEEIMKSWDRLKDEGVIIDDSGDKLKCRLDWVSSGSLNAWARKTDPDSEAITFILNVETYLDPEDRHVFDDGGQLVGKWIYEGSLLSQLLVTPKGGVIKNLPNHTILLQYIPTLAGNLRYNNRSSQVEVSASIHRDHRPGNAKFEAESKQNDWFTLTDAHGIYIKMQLESWYGASINKDELYAAIEFVAGMNGHDAVQEWLDTVAWDGRRRLDGNDAWLCNFMGINRAVEPELFTYYEFIGRAMMLAIVRNIYAVEGHPVSTQHMALMRGNQNFGKSLMASVLAAVDQVGYQYFAEMNSDLLSRGTGDIIQALAGKTVIEIPELSAFSKKDAETVKNFITQRTIEGRKAYGRNTTRLEKATYMIGNTNKYKPLTDATGARRFLMIDFYNDYRNGKVGTYQWDRDALVNLVPQLYAEAKARAVDGIGIPAERLPHTTVYCKRDVDNWNLTSVEVNILDRKNKTYTNLNAVTESVYDILDKLVSQGQTRTTLSAIRKELKEEYQITVQSNLQINEALASQNWQHKRIAGIRVVEFQGEITEEQEARSVTHTTEVLNAPRDVAKSGEATQLNAMAEMLSEMKAMMSALQQENKELKARLEQKELRPEPRRQVAKKAKVKTAPKTAPKAVVEFTADTVIPFLEANGEEALVARYNTLSDDQPTRKARFLKNMISKATRVQASL